MITTTLPQLKLLSSPFFINTDVNKRLYTKVSFGVVRFSFLLMSLLIWCLSNHALAAQNNPNFKGKVFTYEPLNFKYSAQNEKYIKLNEKLVNPDASLFMMHANPKVYFTIIAEALENMDSTEALESFVIANLTSAAKDMSVVSSEDYVVNGMLGRFVIIDAVVSNQSIRYGYWLYVHNGFVYQLVAWGSKRDSHLLNKQFTLLYDGFNLLLPDRVAIAENREYLGTVDNKFLRIDAANSAWMKWDDFAENYPKAIIGGEIANRSFFNIIPFCHMGNRPHDVATNYALINQQGIEYPAEIEKQTQTKVDGLDSVVYTHNWTEDNYNYQGRFVITKGDTCDFMTSFWTIDNEQKADKSLNALLTYIDYKAPKQNQLDAIDVKNSASIFNQAGIYYYNANNFIDALKYFKVAIEHNPQAPLFTNNLLDTFNRLDDFSAAKQYIESNLDNLTFDAEGYSWLGWFYKNLKENALALNYYNTAFKQGFRHNDDVLMYADILIEEQRFDEADEIVMQYTTDINDPDIVIKRAEIKRNLKDYEGAIALINRAQQGKPLNTEFVFEKIYIAKDKGDYKAAIDFADSLLDAGHASAGVYYQKGEAQYALQWYAQSKQSFESALTFAPNNEYVLAYLKDVSAMLGQGDSTAIAQQITPVTFPQMTPKQLLDESAYSDFNSYLLNKVTAIEFTVGKPLKTTKSRTIKLLSDQGVKEFSTIEIGFDSLYESVYINEISVLNNNGEVVNQIDRNDFYVTDNTEDDNLDKTIHIPVANVSKNASIRLTYTKQTLSNLTTFPYTAISHSSATPVVNSMVYVSGDIDQLSYDSFYTSKPLVEDNGLTWTAHFPVVFYDQPMSINPNNYLAAVIINAKNSDWNELAEQYLTEINDKLIVSEKVKTLAYSLTKNSNNREQKINDIVDYIQQNITYKAIEFGIRGRVPNTGETTISLRYGDCKDHAVLLADLLNAVGIEADIVLANLSKDVLPEYPSLDQFNHMIVYLPDNNGGMYIDSTDKDMNLINKAPAGLGGQNVLILKQQASEIKKIPTYHSQHNLITSHRDVQIEEDKRVLVTENFEMTGYLGSQMRHYLKSITAAERFNWAKHFLSERNRDVNLLSFDIHHLTDNRFPISMTSTYQLGNTQLANGDVVFKDAAIWEYYYLLPNDVVERKIDFQIKFPIVYRSKVTINYSDAFTANNVVDKTWNEDRHFLTTKLQTVANKNTINRDFEWIDKPGVFDKSEYKSYRASIEKSIRSLTQLITFQKIKK